MENGKNFMSIVAVVIMLAAVLLTSCGKKAEEKQIPAVRVTTETVSADGALAARNYVGEVVAEHATAVSFSVGGLIQQMLVEEGQHVTKGQTIAIVDGTQTHNALAAAEAVLTQAQDAYDRMKVLHERGSLSDMDWVGVESKLATAKSSYEMARKNAGDTRLTAPCSGIIGKKTAEAGMTVMPSQPVCTILDIRNVKVKVNMPERDMADGLKSGQVQIRVDALGETFGCTGVQKGVQGNPASRTYDVFFMVRNADSRLLPGMVADVKISEAESVDNQNPAAARLTVPVTAVQRRSRGELFVWAMAEGKAVCKTVNIGRTSGGRTEIASGLTVGDKVIVEGYQKLSEGMDVTDK